MEAAHEQDSQSDGRKLKTGKVDFVGLQLSKQTLGRLGQTKGGPEIDEDRRCRKRPSKARQTIATQIVTGTPEENGRDNDIDAHGKDLVR